MIGLDTNVLVRSVVSDDESQASLVRRLLTRLTEERPAYVNLIVLIEAVWIWQRIFNLSKQDVIRALEFLLSKPDIIFERESLVQTALDRFREAQAEFSDVVVALANEEAGCATTYTFDRDASRLGGMTLLDSHADP